MALRKNGSEESGKLKKELRSVQMREGGWKASHITMWVQKQRRRDEDHATCKHIYYRSTCTIMYRPFHAHAQGNFTSTD